MAHKKPESWELVLTDKSMERYRFQKGKNIVDVLYSREFDTAEITGVGKSFFSSEDSVEIKRKARLEIKESPTAEMNIYNWVGVGIMISFFVGLVVMLCVMLGFWQGLGVFFGSVGLTALLVLASVLITKE